MVINADIGKIAGRKGELFGTISALTGVIVTKMDGSGKGGGELSAVAATKAKIAFIGVGEKTDDFEVYDAKRFVGRLLGMPDIKGLVEKIETIQKEEALEEMEGEELTIENFYKQLKAAKKMGPLGNVLGMMGMSDLPKDALATGEEKMKKYEAMINSMTRAERKDATLLRKSNSRIERVAKGSGCSAQDVKSFLNEFEKMDKMMNMFKKNRGFRKQMEKFMKGGGAGLKGLGM
ncbi:Signal recognition particle 54 kDa protein [uncultured archaeon]|nr:Signal recognition particle 54 kDa protein [uncultured archaeon]